MIQESDLQNVGELLKSARAIRESDYSSGAKCLLLRVLVARTRGLFADLSVENLSIAERQDAFALKQRQDEEKEQEKYHPDFEFFEFPNIELPPLEVEES